MSHTHTHTHIHTLLRYWMMMCRIVFIAWYCISSGFVHVFLILIFFLFSLLSSLFIFPSPSPPLGSSIDAIRACIDVILKSSCHLLSTSTSSTTDTNCSERNKIGNTRDDTGNASDDETYTSCRSGRSDNGLVTTIDT